MALASNKSLRILVVSDNYLVGGRETYIKCYLKALQKRIKVEVGLLVGQVDADFAKGVFQKIYQVAKNDNGPIQNAAAWLKKGDEALDDFKADIIWVHHYCLLPAWALSVYKNVPLLCTMHGSLFSQGRLVDLNDSRGLACILQYGGQLSTVSREISDEIVSVTDGKVESTEIALLVNAVDVVNTLSSTLESKCRNPQVLMLTRQQKLGHLRASVLLFSKIVEVFPHAKLMLHTGFSMLDNSSLPMKRSILKVLGRKWVIRNFRVLRCINRIQLKPLCNNVQQTISQSDIVFGMGRVVLEAVAANKPAVLIGYDKPITLVSNNNFKELQYTNFSGRELLATPIDQLVNEIAVAISDRKTQPENLLKQVDVDVKVADLERIIYKLLSNSIEYWSQIPIDVSTCIKALFNNLNKAEFDLVEKRLQELERLVSLTLSKYQNVIEKSKSE